MPWNILYWLGKATVVPKCHSYWPAAAGLPTNIAKWHRLQHSQVTAALSASVTQYMFPGDQGMEGVGQGAAKHQISILVGCRQSPPFKSLMGKWLPQGSIELGIQCPLKSRLALEFEITQEWDIFDWYSIQMVVRFPWLFHLALGSDPVKMHQNSNAEICEAEREAENGVRVQWFPRGETQITPTAATELGEVWLWNGTWKTWSPIHLS